MGRVTLVALAVLALAASAGVAGAQTYRWVAAAFGLEPILATVRSVLRTGYDPQLMGVFVARLRTPTLRRLTAMEVEADTPELAQKLPAFAAGVKGGPPPPR